MVQLTGVAFPSRPMKATRSVFAGGIAKLLSAVLFLGFALGLGIWQGPGLWRDVQIAQNPVEVYDFDILDGECRTQRAILTNCEADLRYTYEGKTIESHTSFAFVDFNSGDYYVGVVIKGDQPWLATLDLGIDMLWNRLAVGGGFFLLFAGLTIGGVVGFIRTVRDNGGARAGGQVTPVALDVLQNSKVLGGRTLGYRVAGMGKKKFPAATVRWKKDDEPVWIESADGGVYALGAQMEGVKQPILLDQKLERLDFNASERMTLNTALSRAASRHAGEWSVPG